MSALAEILVSQGHTVSGSDIALSSITEKLQSKGIKVFEGHDEKNICNSDCVVYTAAICKKNPEYLAALNRELPVFSRAEVLGMISKHYKKTVAIAGTHGKTTTTAMISSILIDAGLDPTVHLGGEHKKINGNVRLGKTRNIFVTEACEYVDSFLEISSDISVLLNIQPDHLDYFKNLENMMNSFNRFASNTSKNGSVVLNIDDENCSRICPENKKVITYSAEKKADYEAKRIVCSKSGYYSFDCFEYGKFLGRFHLGILGRHNIYNAMAAIVVARIFGIDFYSLSRSLYEFLGVGRRFELVGELNGAEIIHDYAHHPTEIKSSVSIARDITKGKIIVVFQPHTYSRTRDFFNAFVESLALADLVIMYPIYPAREEPIPGITSAEIAKHINQAGTKSIHVSTYAECYKLIESESKKGDVVLILGAGNIVGLGELFKKKIVD